jgi:pilus assembly protein Flp/PilA
MRPPIPGTARALRCCGSPDVISGAGPGRGVTKRSIAVCLIRNVVKAMNGDERGQGLAEYALILALIAIVSIVALTFLGGQISSIITEISESM